MFNTSVNVDSLEVCLEVKSLDASNAVELKTLLKELDLQGKDRLVLNLKNVEFMDSSGIGVLLSLYKQHNQKVSLKQPSASVLSVLELLRLHRIFEIESA
ncbi:MAG: anti-sigma B factor antagonist [Lentimonas sp.]|jgi:anti-sigma B factor antagonist